jgi:hypothetical protein
MSIAKGSITVSGIVCGFVFCVRNSINENIAGCEFHQISYGSNLRACISFQGPASVYFELSAAKILRYKIHRGPSSLLIITLVKPKDKCDSSYLCNFGFDIHLRLLVWYSVYTRQKSMHYSVVHKTPFISTLYWNVKITRSKYYRMCVLRLYTMELKCLHVNTSQSTS